MDGDAGGFIFNGANLKTGEEDLAASVHKAPALPRSPQIDSPSYRMIQDAKVKSFGDPNNDNLYNQVEDFLSTPSPSFDTIAASIVGKSAVSLPQLQKERSQLRKANPKPPSGKSSSSARPKPKATKKMAKSTSGPIDTQLLAEAMAYADSLGSLMDRVTSEDTEARKSSKKKKAAKQAEWNDSNDIGVSSSRGGGRSNSSKKPSSADAGLGRSRSKPTVGRLRVSRSAGAKAERERAVEQRQKAGRGKSGKGKKGCAQRSSSPTFDSSSSKSSNNMDSSLFDQLLANFKTGNSLQALKDELAQSQASMAKSRDVLMSEMEAQYSASQQRKS